MTFKFTKMHGLGNDFVVIDAVTQSIQMTPKLAKQIANRQYGVGCDQVLIVGPAHTDKADFEYRIFNADGSEALQCGNGARCVGRFIKARGLLDQPIIRLVTARGDIVQVKVLDDHQVQVDIGIPNFNPSALPFIIENNGGTRAALAEQVRNDEAHAQPPSHTFQIAGTKFVCDAVSVGNPHIVTTVTDFDLKAMREIADYFSHHDAFPEGVNVGFMKIHSPDRVTLRVAERGSGLTEACGSGACAAVAVGRRQGLLADEVAVEQPGGTLQVRWKNKGDVIRLQGPAEFVFEGVM